MPRADAHAPVSFPRLGPDPALPAWITPELVATARAAFQPSYPTETLTDDDVVQMLLTMGELFRILCGTESDHEQRDQTTSTNTRQETDRSPQALRRAG